MEITKFEGNRYLKYDLSFEWIYQSNESKINGKWNELYELYAYPSLELFFKKSSRTSKKRHNIQTKLSNRMNQKKKKKIKKGKIIWKISLHT